MSRSLTRVSLALFLLLSSEVWAIGLGDINLDSALNEPLRAEIELLSPTPEELANLNVSLASAETFARYGIDRPFYLQGIEFNIVENGPNSAVIQIRSRAPITEPFLTFLVEATWASGRLLREYTVLLDPPTYAPPAVREAPAVAAPRRATPTDSGRIDREPQPAQPERRTPPAAQPRVTPPASQAPDDSYVPPPAPGESPYSSAPAGDYYVERGDTLWGIASRMRPDNRLTMNQTMMAIFQANPEAFSNNINRLSAGASLRIPSADEVFQISRYDAFSAVKQQNEEWGGPAAVAAADTRYADTAVDTPAETAADAPADSADASEPEPAETRPSLTLVPPDEEPAGIEYDDDLTTSEPTSREQEIQNRIAELEAADVPDQQSLIEIRDNELASLRQQLADIRGEVYEPPAADVSADETTDDEVFADTDAGAADEAAVEDEADATPPTDDVRTPRVSEPGIMDRVMEILGSWWLQVGAAVVVAAGLLLWFLRRGGDDDDDASPWETLDSDELATGAMAATETLRAPTHDDESIVVVEQDSGIRPMEPDATEGIDTIEAPSPEIGAPTGDAGEFGSLEDTFSSETAVNLDQTDPLAEADFHMAYGLYDQAADLVNGALESDPNDTTLMAKLCEIYFVWGNQDAFVDAAAKLKAAVGGGESAQWDKIVIMGQQIAADHALFAGAGVAGATKAVDLSFEAEMDDAAELDMDFGGDGPGESDIIDLGGVDDAAAADDGIDFVFDEETGERVAIGESTAEQPSVEEPETIEAGLDATAEMPEASEPTVETPTIEEQFAGLEGTSELPSLDGALGDAIADGGMDSDATAEINLDELDLDITGTNEELSDTGINEALGDFGDDTGKNPELDVSLDSGDDDAFDFGDMEETGMRLAPDETGRMPLADVEQETETSIDLDLLEATGRTQILSDDMAVETAADLDASIDDDDATMLAPGYGDEDTEVSGDAETMLAPMDEDEYDFDFAKTEALPPEAFTGTASLDETGEMPAVAQTDVDLDLDDLTAALAVSEVGDTVEQPRDDATVEQPRPSVSDETAEIPTMSIPPEDMSGDLHDARTMTEVGTKLDLARAYVDMGDPAGARGILEEVLDEGDEGQRQQAQQLLDSLPS